MLSIKKFSGIFILFWVLTVLIYQNGLGSQFVDDYIAGIVRFMDVGWAGLADSYEFTSLYFGHNITFYGFYSLFGSSPVAWFLLFTGLHSLNAAFTYAFVKKLFSNNQFPAATTGATIISLLFLLSPYQTENVIWGATLHYAVSMVCMWGIIWLYTAYLNNSKTILLVCMYLLFAFSLVTLEISLVFPGVFMIVFGILWQPSISVSNILKHLKIIALPMAIIIVCYFTATYAFKGHFIGHYGSGTHMQFNPTQLIGAMWKYLAKLLGFVHWFPYEHKERVYVLFDNPKIAVTLLVFLSGALIGLYKYRKRYATFIVGWSLLIFVLLLPVLNMYFMYLNQGENDRLSYFASAYIYGIPVLLFMWFSGRLLWAYGIVMLAVCILLLQIQTQKWENAAAIQLKAADSPLLYNPNGNVYLLNLPVYYRGVYIYRNYNRFGWAREFYELPNVSASTKYILSYNLQNPSDSVIVSALPEPNTFKVELSTWGNWFWYGNKGAQNRADDDMTITLDEWGHSYTISIPELKPQDRLLYFSLNGWTEVKKP